MTMSTNFRILAPALAASLALTASVRAADATVPSGTDQVTAGSAATDPKGSGIGRALVTDAKSAPEKDGITRQGGVVYITKNGQRQRVEQEMKLGDLVVRPNGSITTKDGKNMEVQEGQYVTMEGQVINAAAPNAPGGAISTTTDNPSKDALNNTGKSSAVEANPASPTGATRNMAPVRGQAATPPAVKDANSSASGLTTPGASSGSSLGSGSNSTITPAKTEEKPKPDAK